MSEEEGSWTVFRLPRSHWHCQLTNFKWDSVTPLALRESINEFLFQTVATKKAPHLVLFGDPGCGKSHLSSGVYRVAVRNLASKLVTWIDVPSFCQNVKKAMGTPDFERFFEDVEEAKRLVVLDDLFGKELSPYEIEQILYRLINTCEQNQAAVFVTMNPHVTELQTRLRPHEVSRLLANGKGIHVRSTHDWRRR